MPVRADHMTISNDGKKLYVSAVIMGGDIVEILNTETGEKIGEIQAGPQPHDIHVSGDDKRVYVASLGEMLEPLEERNTNNDSYRVTLATTDTFEIINEYIFESGVRPFQVSSSGKNLYAQLSNTHSVVALDLLSNKFIAKIDMPVAEGVTVSDWDFEAPHHGLALSSDEAVLCIAGRASDYAGIVNTENLTLQATIAVGDAPSWAEFSADGDKCLLANTRSDDVSIVSVSQEKELARMPVGRGPKHITVGQVPLSVINGFMR